MRRLPLLLILAAAPAIAAEPSVSGQTGLISMPDARFAPEGSWRTGLSFLRPYQSIWSGVSVFPWLETSFRYSRIYHVPGFAGTPQDPSFGRGYGDFKDKAFDAKLLVLPERGIWPAIAVGAQDIGGGTSIFRAPYAVASKQLGELDLSAGYGGRRIDGLFGGARWAPAAAPNWSLVAEYDAYNYKRDPFSDLSGAASYRKEPAVGLEYHRPETVPNTRPALRLSELARERGLHQPFHDRLMDAYWSQATNIGEPDELRRLAAEVGLDADDVDRVIADASEYLDVVEASTHEAQSIGINAIPAFVLDRRLIVLGAQPLAVFRDAFAQLDSAGRERRD